MDKLKMGSLKKLGKIVGTVVGGLIIALIVLMVVFKFVPGYGFYVVLSGSMSPTINPGDLVFTHQVSQVKPGEVITFETNNEIVTHRAVAITNGQITTKGDANKTPDPGTITQSNVRGAELFRLPAIGYVTNLTNSKGGWFLIVIVPTMLIVFFIVKDILKEAFKDDKKKPAQGKKAAPAAGPKTLPEVQTATVSLEQPVPESPKSRNPGKKPQPEASPAASETNPSGPMVLTASTASLDLTAVFPSAQKERLSQAAAKTPPPAKPQPISSGGKVTRTDLSPALKELFNTQTKVASGQIAIEDTPVGNLVKKAATQETKTQPVNSAVNKKPASNLSRTIKKIFFIQK